MGCDIHMYCEKKIEFKDKSFWICCDDFTLNPYYEMGKDSNKYDHRSIYNARNYSLFGRLAGVRDQSVPMIDTPRGLPNDVSDFVKSESDDWKLDAHSHSYFTVKELLEYDKKYHDKAFHYLIKLIKKRMKREFDIWDFFNKQEKNELIKSHSEEFRIVFWFDN